MKQCEVCGSTVGKITKSRKFNLIVCIKHYSQLRKHGKIVRTMYDPNRIIFHEDYAEICLYDANGNLKESAVIDIEDISRVTPYKWCLHDGYAYRRSGSKLIALHREIMDPKGNKVVDHIDRNRLNNRKSNLRVTTQQVNVINRGLRSDNKFNHVGVHFDKKRNKYYAKIQANGKQIFLGYTDTLEESVENRLKAEKEIFKDYI
jgi:hypothetical protein